MNYLNTHYTISNRRYIIEDKEKNEIFKHCCYIYNNYSEFINFNWNLYEFNSMNYYLKYFIYIKIVFQLIIF